MTVGPDSLAEALRRAREDPEALRRARNRERSKALAVVLAMLGFFGAGSAVLVATLARALSEALQR